MSAARAALETLPGTATDVLPIVLQTMHAPKIMMLLAGDSDGVTTSTVTLPLITALGPGLAESVPGRRPLSDGVGLVAFASLLPIVVVLAYARITFYWQARLARSRSDAARAVPEPAKEES